MKRFNLTLAVLSILLSGSLLLSLGGALSAQPFGGHRGGGPGRGFFSELTDEQRETIRDLMEEMRAAGASREEIHQAISGLFAEWGMEMPEGPGGLGGRRGGHDGREGRGERGSLGDQLTEEQRAALHSTMLQMWRDGDSREEIRDAVVELLEGWGIEPPEHDREHHGPGRGRDHSGHFLRGILDQLSEEQREELHQLIGELRQQSASHDEIRAAVEGKLSEWGIELPEPPLELTREQRQALHAVIFELWTSGATREEIRSAAAGQLEEYGIEMPEHGPGPWGHRLGSGRHGKSPLPMAAIHGCLKPPLTQEQRETLHETIRELREEGASPEEIHEAIRSLMSDFGIEVPDLDAELSDDQRATLRTTVLDLWLAGASREEICQEVTDLLNDFGIELPEESSELPSEGTSDMAPIRAQNYPNPANPETQINYTLGVSDDVRIQIYNISGQLVRTYDIGYQRQGSYSVRWDGRHQNGQSVASGVYFYRIQAGEHALTNRIVLLK
jgi:Spy/CpxP family protein refolding chaperone